MVVYPAVVHHTRPEGLMIEACAVTVAVAFAVELLLVIVPPRPKLAPSRLTVRSATAVLAIGAIAEVGLVLAGNASYAAQVAGASRSHVAAVFTPFAPWLTFGGVMFIWLWRQAKASRSMAWLAMGAVLAIELLGLVRTGATAALAASALTFAFVAVVLRLVRLRWVVIAIALIPLLWPPLYNFRNGIRQRQVATYQVGLAPSASQRLREDLNFGRIEYLPVVPDQAIAPSYAALVRFGLLPRAVDRGRGNLETADQISVAEGGTLTSAATLTSIGDAYAIDGWTGLVIYALMITVVMAVALRRRSLWGYLVAATLVTSAIWIESTYPDLIAAVLQGLVSLAVAAAVVALLAPSRRGVRVPVTVRPLEAGRRGASVEPTVSAAASSPARARRVSSGSAWSLRSRSGPSRG